MAEVGPSPGALRHFESLTRDFTPSHLVTLSSEVDAHLDEIRQAARRNELLPVDLAEELARKLKGLLVTLGALPPDGQRLVIGAARYFISTNDEHPDTETVLGLDDDALIFNYAMDRIGRADLRIDL
jgi:hypothetical protein